MSTKNIQKDIKEKREKVSNVPHSNKSSLVKNEVLGVSVTSSSEENILEYIVKKIESYAEDKEKLLIVTPNPEILVYANKHKEFRDILNQAQISLPDGVGVLWAGRVLGKPFQQRITGVDFMKSLCKEVIRKPITVGFLGGRGGVAEVTSKCLQKAYPGLKVGFVGEEPGGISNFKFQISNAQSRRFEETITCDILFVAFGFPKQEEWMAENLEKLDVKVMMGVGGAFDYISGKVPRAPKLIRAIGFEWLYRLLRQPWRWKRQLALVEFVGLVLREKFSSK